MQRRRILTIIFTACICVAFLNYISLKNEIEILPYLINQASEGLVLSQLYDPTHYPTILTALEEMKFQYFIVLSRFWATTISCVGFAILSLWKMDASQPKLPSMIRSKKMRVSTRTRIFTAIYTACICVAFLNFIFLKHELEYLPRHIGQEVQILSNPLNPTSLANLDSLRFQYFLVLSQFMVVSIFCAGFAIMTQWKIETLDKPQPTSLNNKQQKILVHKEVQQQNRIGMRSWV